MALQTKTFTTAKDGYEIALTLTERDMDRKANTTDVSYKFTVGNGGERFRAENCSWSILIAGQTIPIVDYVFNLSKSDPQRVIASGRLTVQHDPDGTCAMPYAVSVPAVSGGVPAMELTGTWELTPIPRIPEVYCPDGFIGETVPVRIDALDKDLRYTLSYAFGALQGTVAENLPASEISWTIPPDFYEQLPNAKEGVCRLTCTAYANGAQIGSGTCEFAVKADPKENVPEIFPDVFDSNPDTVALTGDEAVLVRYCSDARVTVWYQAKNSATVAESAVLHRDAVRRESIVNFYGVESGEFRFRVTDSRGFSAAKTVTKELVPYIKLTCDLGDNKPDGDGDMTLKVSGNYFNGSFGAQSNSLTVEYRYKPAGGSYGAWIPMEPSVAARSYTAQAKLTGLDYQTAYTFQARAKDKLWVADSEEYTVKAMPVFDWDENDFNVNGTLKLNNEAVADFVVSRGKNGIWTWEKWNSGIAKCWGITGEKSFTFTGSGPVYHSGTVHSYSYPLALTEIASVGAEIISEGYAVPVVLSTDGELRVSPVRLYGGSDSVTGRYAFQILGRWK